MIDLLTLDIPQQLHTSDVISLAYDDTELFFNLIIVYLKELKVCEFKPVVSSPYMILQHYYFLKIFLVLLNVITQINEEQDKKLVAEVWNHVFTHEQSDGFHIPALIKIKTQKDQVEFFLHTLFEIECDPNILFKLERTPDTEIIFKTWKEENYKELGDGKTLLVYRLKTSLLDQVVDFYTSLLFILQTKRDLFQPTETSYNEVYKFISDILSFLDHPIETLNLNSKNLIYNALYKKPTDP